MKLWALNDGNLWQDDVCARCLLSLNVFDWGSTSTIVKIVRWETSVEITIRSYIYVTELERERSWSNSTLTYIQGCDTDIECERKIETLVRFMNTSSIPEGHCNVSITLAICRSETDTTQLDNQVCWCACARSTRYIPNTLTLTVSARIHQLYIHHSQCHICLWQPKPDYTYDRTSHVYYPILQYNHGRRIWLDRTDLPLSYITYKINATFKHIKGHQDDHTPYHQLTLLPQLNVDADQLAAQDSTKKVHPPPKQHNCFQHVQLFLISEGWPSPMTTTHSW